MAEAEFTIWLFRQADLEQLLAAFDNPPFRLAFLWDLPDTVAMFEVSRSPKPEQLASFFECVGDAKPAHNAGEEFSPFYRTAR
jgi:hypothetical protein